MRPELLERALSLLPLPLSDADTPHPDSVQQELARYFAMLRDYPIRGGKGIRSELLLASAAAHGVVVRTGS
jgi:geranylgeranyl diphosphate synthase type II